MVIAKITLTFTNHVVLTGDVSFNPATEVVSVPPHMTEAVAFFQEGECLPQIELAIGDKRFEVIKGSDGIYAARAIKPARNTNGLLAGFASLVRPTELQSQQMGRTAHALAVSALLGAIGVGRWNEPGPVTESIVIETCLLLTTFVLLLCTGNELMERSK